MNLLERTKETIRCWVEAWGGQEKVAVSYSGGVDSTALLRIVREIYPDVPGVFANTGLEHPSIIEHVKRTPNVVVVRPKKPFHKVIKDHGWPVISKEVARYVSDCQNASERNQKTVNLRLTGYTSKGVRAPSQMLSLKWRPLIAAPFKVSDVCCEYLKKRPLEACYKESGLRPMVGSMRAESNRRAKTISAHQCNLYDAKKPISYPLANWTPQHVWAYIRHFKVPYAKAYDQGETRTGCVFCMFGIMNDPERFLRLKVSSPKQYNYVVHELGASEVLEFIGIPY